MPNYEEIIQQSHENIKSLSEKLNDFENLIKEIKSLKAAAEGLPDVFDKKFEELIKLSADYTNTLGAATKIYLNGNNTLFTSKLREFSSKVKELEKEITRLVNTDFNNLFQGLQKVFIEQTRNDLALELKKFDSKSQDFQKKIDELKKEIERLEKIDFEKHIDKLQKTLSEIFGAINAINISLTNIIQTLTGIVQSLGTIQTTLDTNHKETKQFLATFSESIEKHLTDQDNQTKKNFELLENKIYSVSEQNEWLRKEIKTNRIIQIVGLTIIVIFFIYVALKI